ncbi:melatonin-related receptor-like [Stylophora pistillata]|uniref:melatonin-related receptor-like n=1 Tax=Stylophora pistillata TaxID=50429 RepID=UPI000C042C9F|nr:melatonin-related receptor-like [Stylophora pistillata]
MASPEQQLEAMAKEMQSRSTVLIVLESLAFALILLLLFVGNAATLLIIAFNSRMRTTTNVFVASLAISDFLLGVLSAGPIAFPTLLLSKWPFDDATCQYQGYIAVTLAVASTQTLALMAVNRYFRIVRPRKYQTYFTVKKTLIMIFLSWFYCMWAPLPYLLSGYKMVFHPFKFFCYLQIDSGPFTAFLVTVYVGLPTCIMVFCYLRIFQTIRSHNNNFRATSGSRNAVHVEEIRITRTLFVIVVFFNICWTPVFLIDMVDTIRGKWSLPREAYVAYTFLAIISSALNPVIYGVLNKNFQQEYLKIFRCRYCSSQTFVQQLN